MTKQKLVETLACNMFYFNSRTRDIVLNKLSNTSYICIVRYKGHYRVTNDNNEVILNLGSAATFIKSKIYFKIED